MPFGVRPLSSLWDWDVMVDRSRPSRLFDQNFGLTLDDDQIFASHPAAATPPGYSIFPYVSSHYRPRRLHTRQESGISQVDCNKEKFEVKLDVQQFSPEEITVKTVNTTVVIEGKHEEKQDEHGFISRHFVRKYILPEDVKPENVLCNLSSDGVLTISAVRVVEKPDEAVKVVPIIQTGRPAVVRQTSKEPMSVSSTTTQAGNNATSGNTTTINIQREGGGNQ